MDRFLNICIGVKDKDFKSHKDNVQKEEKKTEKKRVGTCENSKNTGFNSLILSPLSITFYYSLIL